MHSRGDDDDARIVAKFQSGCQFVDQERMTQMIAGDSAFVSEGGALMFLIIGGGSSRSSVGDDDVNSWVLFYDVLHCGRDRKQIRQIEHESIKTRLLFDVVSDF